MSKVSIRTPFGAILIFAMLIAGIGTGWCLRQNNWDKELMQAVEEIAKQNGTVYVEEFDGVVGLELPRQAFEKTIRTKD